MKILDGHSDIFSDIAVKRLEGKKDIFKNYHLDMLKHGDIEGSIVVVWIDTRPPYDPTWRMLEILGAVSQEINDMKDYAQIVLKYTDIEEIRKSGRIYIIMGMEGLSGLKGNISLIDMLYRLGIRHASFTWNEDNEFASGVGSFNGDRGLTPLGVEALKRMERLGILVDVSHANEKTFWDIYENSQKPFIASHSNAYRLCSVPRNLKDDQIKAIAERKGVIGINSWPYFVHQTSPTIETFVNHIDYMVNLAGIDYVGLGFDFCRYLSSSAVSAFSTNRLNASAGLEDVSKAQNVIDILAKRGYKDEDIEKIAHKNFERVLKDILK